jgi:hypothetical protein
MGRILAFILGGLALALYAPNLFLGADDLAGYAGWWKKLLGEDGYAKVFTHGPGVFAGLGLILFAVRGRDGPPDHRP